MMTLEQHQHSLSFWRSLGRLQGKTKAKAEHFIKLHTEAILQLEQETELATPSKETA